MDAFSVSTNTYKVKNSHKSPDKSAAKTDKATVLQQISVAQNTPRTVQLESTRNNSHKNSIVSEEVENIDVASRNRDFKKNRKVNSKNVFNKITSLTSQIEHEPIIQKQPIRAPVRIDIPLEEQNKMEGMTLAEAFKKRVGRLKSQQRNLSKVDDKSPNPKNGLKM